MEYEGVSKDWLPGARTANGTALCHLVQLYRYFVSQCSEFCHHNPLCCFSTSVYCCKRIFSYRLSPETFGYTLLYRVRVFLVVRFTETNQPTPCSSWVFLEKLIFKKTVNKFPAFYETQRCITVLTKAHPKHCVTFRKKPVFLWWGVVSPSPNPQAGRVSVYIKMCRQ
jgi:hypothetical protein